MNGLVFLYVVAGVISVPQGEGAPGTRATLPIRMWLIHDYDLAYIDRVIELAPKEGINYLQLSHGIVHDIEDLLNDEKRQRDFPGIVARAHAAGVKVLLWTHELNAVPEEFRAGGRVDLGRPELWNWLRGKYERVFAELVPDVDGLVLTFHETQVSVYDDAKVISGDPPSARVTRLIDEVSGVCRRYGKELYVRTFVYRPEELEWVVEGITPADPEVRVMSKSVPHDWHPFYPHNPALGRFPGRIQIVEFDLCGEYYGQSVVPYCTLDEVNYRLDYARSRGVQGAVARIDRYRHHALDTPNWVNVEAFDRLLRDPTVSVDRIWNDFCVREYGAEAAPIVRRALERSRDIIEQLYLTGRFYFLNNHSGVPSVEYADRHIQSHSIAKWDPAYATTEERLLRPNEAVYRKLIQEKDDAIVLVYRSLDDLRAGKLLLDPADYADLRERFEKLLRCARLWRDLTDAYFRWRIFEETREEGDRVRLDYAVRALESEAAWLERAVGEDAVWESAANARRFAAELRRRAEARGKGNL